MNPDIKQKLVGSLDLLFLFPRGIGAFGGDRRVAIRTLVLVELLVMPLLPITVSMAPPLGMEGLPYQRVLLTMFAHYCVTLALSLALNWQIAGLLNKRPRFWLAMEAGAWCKLVFCAFVMVPLLCFDIFRLAPYDTMQRIYIILACYSYVFGACIAYAVYRINIFLIVGWMMAGLFIDRESWNVLYLLQGLPPLP